jgi:hypothetical protein
MTEIMKKCNGCPLGNSFENMLLCSIPFDFIGFNSFALCTSPNTVLWGLDVLEEVRLHKEKSNC